MDKKGQVTWGQLLPLIIGLAVVLIVIYFWYGLGESGEDITDAIPDAVSAKAQVCKSVYAPIKNIAGWCNPSEIDDNEYMNCKYIKEKYDSTLGENFNPGCKGVEETFCQQLNNTQGEKYESEKIFVNNNTCQGWGVE